MYILKEGREETSVLVMVSTAAMKCHDHPKLGEERDM